VSVHRSLAQRLTSATFRRALDVQSTISVSRRVWSMNGWSNIEPNRALILARKRTLIDLSTARPIIVLRWKVGTIGYNGLNDEMHETSRGCMIEYDRQG
jgi:hypothetical protein